MTARLTSDKRIYLFADYIHDLCVIENYQKFTYKHKPIIQFKPHLLNNFSLITGITYFVTISKILLVRYFRIHSMEKHLNFPMKTELGLYFKYRLRFCMLCRY